MLNLQHLHDVTVPLPPLIEQRHIVARIEELAAKIEEARGVRRESMKEADPLQPAVLDRAFRGEL